MVGTLCLSLSPPYEPGLWRTGRAGAGCMLCFRTPSSTVLTRSQHLSGCPFCTLMDRPQLRRAALNTPTRYPFPYEVAGRWVQSVRGHVCRTPAATTTTDNRLILLAVVLVFVLTRSFPRSLARLLGCCPLLCSVWGPSCRWPVCPVPSLEAGWVSLGTWIGN